MAIKTISQFDAAVPTDNDYILFEQNGEGKSAKFSDFSLGYEEILDSTDLSGKVASAVALKRISKISFKEKGLATDLNTVLDSGAYTFITENSTNIPFNYGVLLVINPRAYYIAQIAISVTGEGVKYRFSQNAGTTWEDWRNING